ncbi:MAG: hypothetical protein ACFFCS_16740 [Candidatus Hodarchaeota archaeon]
MLQCQLILLMFLAVGLKYLKYDYMYSFPTDKKDDREKIPLSLSVVDSAGQNLKDWLSERKDRVFPGSDIIFFIFDVSEWLEDATRTEIQDMIMEIYNQRLELAPESTFYIIAHKFDKIEGKARDQMRKQIKKELNDYVFDKMMKFLDFEIYITSLEEDYVNDTFLTILNLTTDLIARSGSG